MPGAAPIFFALPWDVPLPLSLGVRSDLRGAVPARSDSGFGRLFLAFGTGGIGSLDSGNSSIFGLSHPECWSQERDFQFYL